jgi:small subunit ribosomal protein S18
MAAKPKRSTKPRDAMRRGGKKKVSVLVSESVEYVDWKDVNLLRRFVSDRAKIRARRVSGNDTQQQREIAKAIKNAREMALLPYTSRVTTQRGRPSRGDDDGARRGRPRRDESESAEFEPLDGVEVERGDEVESEDVAVAEVAE